MWVSWALWLENTPGREKRMSTNRGQAKENVKSCPMMKFHRITKSQSLNLYINRGRSQKTMLCLKGKICNTHICIDIDIDRYVNVDINLEGKHIKLIIVIVSGEWRKG